MERISRNRAVAVLLLFAAILSLFSFRMYGLQVRDVDPDTEPGHCGPGRDSGPERERFGDQPGQL